MANENKKKDIDKFDIAELGKTQRYLLEKIKEYDEGACPLVDLINSWEDYRGACERCGLTVMEAKTTLNHYMKMVVGRSIFVSKNNAIDK